jgi:hypothetical protein
MSLRRLPSVQSRNVAFSRGLLTSEEAGFVAGLAPGHASGAERSARPADSDEHGEQTLVVRFEPLSTGTGQILVAAQVVGMRLFAIARGLEDPDRAPLPCREPPLLGSKILVEIETPSEGRMHATIKLDSGALGPITLELDFSRGHLELRATVCTSRAAQTLAASEVALREGLALAGLDLRGMQVLLAPKRAAVRPLRPLNDTYEER